MDPFLFIFSETNIQRHEKPDSTRTSLRNKFCEFDELFEKCLRGDRKERPRDAIELRSEAIFADFLERLENGARPSDLVRPPFEDEKETQIRELKQEIAAKRSEFERNFNLKIENLQVEHQASLNKLETTIQEQNETISEMKNQNEDLQKENRKNGEKVLSWKKF